MDHHSYLNLAFKWATILGTVGGFVSGCGYVVRWVVMWFWRVDTAVSNHIPHMEKMLRMICKKMHIDYEGPEGD